MKTQYFNALALAALTSLIAAPVSASAADAESVVYVAQLHPLNSKVSGHDASGEARFTVAKGTLTIRIDMKDVPPNLEHWQHFHGFKDNHGAACATDTADANHDGVIDLIETEPASGTTMVPFNSDPAAMHVASNTYPKASADGTYQYRKVVSLKAMKASFAKALGDSDLDLDHRVIYIHGVPPSTKLPASVASLGTIPAQVTLPIACGKIERVSR